MSWTAWRLLKRSAIAAAVGASTVIGSTVVYVNYDTDRQWRDKLLTVANAKDFSGQLKQRPTQPITSRPDVLKALQTPGVEYDVLVIGGGATGSGIAIDSQTRGLSTALIEYDDYSSGTSSRSTKLIHGGVRYLQSAIMKADIEQYRMVKEALHERANLLEIAPHLAYPLPIMLPVYKWWQLPYYWVGIKMYDLVSGRRLLRSSYAIGKQSALELFPMLAKNDLVGALIYYDGQHNDARMCISLVMSAIRHGCHATNHAMVTDLVKNDEGVVCGAIVVDRISGKKWPVRAKCVINATGPFMDTIRMMDNPESRPLCIPSAGVHIVLPGYYSPVGTGLLDPATKDGRVVFFLPWEKMTVAGTTDSESDITHSPAPHEQDVQFILDEIRHYLSKDISVRRGDVLSAWSGLRPLVRDPNKADTKSLARNHIIEVSASKLISIGGGKWTTYRQMAEDTIDKAIEVCNLKPKRACMTTGLILEGGHEWSELLFVRLVQDFGLDVDVAQHLSATYGDRAISVAKLARITGKRWPLAGKRLHPEFPYLDAEVRYAIREHACTATDMIARRLRLAFLNTYAAAEALPDVVEIMAEELKWDKKEKMAQLAEARRFIEVEMGQNARISSIATAPLNLTQDEVADAKTTFQMLDKNKNGYITLNDLRRHFKDLGEKVDESVLHEILNEVDLDKNGEVTLLEWLQLHSGLKGGQISASRLSKYLEKHAELKAPTVARTGGGV